MTNIVRCSFYEQIPAEDQPGKFRYEAIDVSNVEGSGSLPTLHPPLVGDLIVLFDSERGAGSYRVIDRQWMHAQYGSRRWQHGESMPNTGPTLQFVVRAEPGLFRDEARSEDD